MFCANCGYRLSAADGLGRRCSECGRPFDPDDHRTWESRRRPPGMLVGFGLAIACVAATIGGIAFAIRFDYGHDFDTALAVFLAGGSLLSLLTVFAAVRNRSVVGRSPLLLAAVLAGWAAVAMGIDHGYRVWQGGPNPPDEAFADADGVIGFLAGWIPAGLGVAVVFRLLLPIASGRRRLPLPDRPHPTPPPRTTPPTDPRDH